jgi:hypothetical protein
VSNLKPKAYDRVWTAVFKTEDWLESHSAKDVNIVLIGADLDILSGITMNKVRPRLLLAAFDRRGELQYKDDLLRPSLRGGSLGSSRKSAISDVFWQITKIVSKN